MILFSFTLTCNVDISQYIFSEISTVTIEEEKKWGSLYDCRDEITKSLQSVQRLEFELDDYDEVLLSEELNVLLRKKEEINEEMNDLRFVFEYDSGVEDISKFSNAISE